MMSRTLDRARWLVLCGWAVTAACGDNLKLGNAAAPDGGTPDQSGGADGSIPTQTAPQVTIASGMVVGAVQGNSHQFLGIPYAKPPIGDLRWKAPQPAAPWTAPLDATKFGKRCAQLANPTLQNAASNDEDCLYLNVWTPKAASAVLLPVMVWIHGGGNVNGSTSEPVPFDGAGVFYSGEHLAGDHGVIVVSMNYRLGLFGFFSLPALAAEGAGSAEGNQGLLDQRMAMQWVADNIEKFGGDPHRVTIFGESAGSLDVCLHAASPGSFGLLGGVIGESGGCTTRLETQPEGEAIATTTATALGCTGDDALACLRAKPAADLMASDAVQAGLASFGPNVDGDGGVIPDQPRTLYNAGKIAKVPFLFGSNTDEGTLFTLGETIASKDQYAAALAARFNATTAVALSTGLYDPSKPEFANAMPNPFMAAFSRVIGDSMLTCTTFDAAARAAANGNTVFLYNFDIPAAVPASVGYLGATHGSELTSVFGTSMSFTAQTQAASDLIERYWTNFAKSGDPNDPGDLAWPVLTADSNVRINFAADMPTIATDFRKDECTFWQAVYDVQFNGGGNSSPIVTPVRH